MSRSGFTLIEILVAIAIMTIIMGVVVFDHQKFSDQLRITNLAYQIALSVREAQAYGINVRGDVTTGGNQFNVGYGVHFSTEENTSYTTFIDRGDPDDTSSIGNSQYDIDEKITTYILERGNTISDICSKIISGTGSSISTEVNCEAQTIDITFQRPNPDARFVVFPDTVIPAQEVTIKVTNRDGDICKSISVNTNGQISIGECS